MPHMAVADQEKLYLIDKLERLTETGRRLKVQAKEETNLYIGAAVANATSGVIGYYEGRQGKETLFGGLPLDFVVAAAGFGTGFFLKNRDAAKLFYAAGLAGSCIYTYKFGRELGIKMAQPAAAKPSPSASSGVAGVLPPHNPSTGLSDAEISRLIEASRALG
ncbi:MAG TPA: hypothetical protein VJT73_09340 [Polyangiaceae bacterium]|nr:hypothetical protein [Polyangiaceae bacterium]